MPGARIRTIRLSPLNVPLKEPFVISLGPINAVENVVVQVETDDGRTGWGECSPYRTINGESIHTCLAVGREIAQVLLGHDADDIVDAVRKMDHLIYANTSIKSAFDMALHDLAAQYAGLPLYAYLGGNREKELHTDMTVSIGTPEKMAADAARFVADGFPYIKVKLGQELERDVARIRAIRAVVPHEMPLRIDANQGWANADNAIAVLKALAPFGIEHCEEPIPRWQFMDLHRVSTESPIPIMADESCGDEHDAERLIRLKACPMFNIKLGKTGGIYKALKVAALGEAARMELQVGGFMESRLGMTAAAHLALANKAIRHVDFDTPLMFTEDPIEGGIHYGHGGLIEVPDTPGLGLRVKPEWLKDVWTI
ncbi:dipeptide epimerase [Flaviaesturariibacter flavus]|uniref:Dipeptide epimerase n=1 Tax=Flaviaesturariibacter flavus TaxID=2502780 RepID=A0A4R1BAN0_9BACT|nr:dipeptide epimerase [Flaviaesturariibacter flavus]TCJ14004.1 dipeptide epimerase [Flaviaesturariibacter flavus]